METKNNVKILQEKLNILVFPCGSEIALEIYRSLKNSIHFNLIGANSINDHGKFIFEQYIDGLPFVTDEVNCINMLKQIVQKYKIDAIYPAMDKVITIIKKYENELGCKVIAPIYETTDICVSKSKMYEKLHTIINTPHLYSIYDNNIKFPVFCKPDIGYSARGSKKINNQLELIQHLKEQPDSIICEYLPGDEYTVDCFTDRRGKLLFYGPRIRSRISNGISVNTFPVEDNGEFKEIVEKINNAITFRGAWFVQLKRNEKGQLALMEIAARFGGSSCLFRAQGINFAQLTLYDAFDIDVSICKNHYNIEMDRALDTIYKLDIHYSTVYVDFDDCILLDKKYINTELITFLFQCINENKKIILISRHTENITNLLKQLKIYDIFNEIVVVDSNHHKYEYINDMDSIFIDDSFAERNEISKKYNIPVFSLDMIKCLLK